MTVEKLGKPAVVVVTAEFERLAHQMAKHLGHADLKVVVLPYPLEGRPHEELTSIAANTYRTVIDALGAER